MNQAASEREGFSRGRYFEMMLPTRYESNHAADLLELPDGTLLCCWFAGSKEGNADVSIVLSRKEAESTSWSLPIRVSDDPTRSEQNPSLFLHPNGDIWLIYTAQLPKPIDTGEFSIEEIPRFNMQYTAEIRRRISRDGGRTWMPSETIFSKSGSFCRQKIQILSSGRWIFGNWLCFDDDTHNGSDISLVQISDDQGESWRAVEIPGSRGRVHANLIQTGPRSLTAFFRSRAADHIYISHSEDQGEHWKPPVKTALPNNNAGISACRLQSGRLLIVYNDCNANEDPNCAVWPNRRCPITAALSEDGGRTWPYQRIVEHGEGFVGEKNADRNRRYEYPIALQGADRTIHIAYSYGDRECIKYVRVTEDWIIGKDVKE